MEGNQLGKKKAGFVGRELLQTVGATHVGDSPWDMDGCRVCWQSATASPILDFCFTQEKVGVLEYSRSVTQKIDL